MSSFLLDQIEADIEGALKATPGLALAKILRADEGLTEADVAQKLVTLTGEEKIGLGVVVLPTEVVGADKNLPGMSLRVMASVQVIEAVLFNRDAANGTQIKASVAALRVLNALHQYRVGNRLLYAEKTPIEALPMKKGYVGYNVTLFAEHNGGSDAERVLDLAFAIDDDAKMVISTATPDAAIYYTTDGSFPGSTNPEAVLYEGPITISHGMVFRAAAYASPLNPSGISEVRIGIADGSITLNGRVMTMGGRAILL